MNGLTQSKVILYFAVIFVAGAITGTAIVLGNAKRKMFQPPTPEKICTAIQDRLKSKLDLSPLQLQQIQPILDRTTHEIDSIHNKTAAQIDEAFRRANEAIALVLNEEQKKKLQEMENERREFMQKRFKPPEAGILRTPAE